MYELTKEQILEIASTSSSANNLMRKHFPEVFEVVHAPVTVENAIDLSNLSFRNKQLFLANNRFLGTVNQSPMYVYTNKAIIVDSAFKPSIEIVNGRHLIVFENK
jgi:hypothetical protein